MMTSQLHNGYARAQSDELLRAARLHAEHGLPARQRPHRVANAMRSLLSMTHVRRDASRVPAPVVRPEARPA